MNKKKVLIILVVVLTLINVLFIAFHLFGPHRRHGERGKEKQEFVIRELDFDKMQQKEYRNLVVIHSQTILSLRKKQVDIKTNLYQTIGEENTSNKRGDYLQKLSLINNEIELTNLNHFDDIRALCRKDQIPRFKKFRSNLKSFFDPPKPPKR